MAGGVLLQGVINEMSTLSRLHADIDVRVQALRGDYPEWPCSKGCDSCCRRLADMPQLTAPEWDLLREGLAALTPERREDIRRATAEWAASPIRPVVCPMIDQSAATCPVYAQRPVACRTYGFYVQRDKGLYCRDMETQVAEGTMDGLVWGNHEAVERQLVELGETRSLTEWLASMPEGQ